MNIQSECPSVCLYLHTYSKQTKGWEAESPFVLMAYPPFPSPPPTSAPPPPFPLSPSPHPPPII
jgi:hypothetical protein